LSDYIAENISIDKDSRIALATNIIINQDELSTMSKRDLNSLKSMFSKEKINERLPYDRKASIIPRRCSFVGSTNEMEFLMDDTGSVRWLCFEIDEIDWNYTKKVKIDLVYAQAYHLVKNGFNCSLTREDIIENELRKGEFQVFTEEMQLVQKHFYLEDSNEDENFRTSTDVKNRLNQLYGGIVI